jgi:hypothetical protein
MSVPVPMVYVQTDIPEGITIAEHRRATFPPKRTGARIRALFPHSRRSIA